MPNANYINAIDTNNTMPTLSVMYIAICAVMNIVFEAVNVVSRHKKEAKKKSCYRYTGIKVKKNLTLLCACFQQI